jgi:hypothetical protein
MERESGGHQVRPEPHGRLYVTQRERLDLHNASVDEDLATRGAAVLRAWHRVRYAIFQRVTAALVCSLAAIVSLLKLIDEPQSFTEKGVLSILQQLRYWTMHHDPRREILANTGSSDPPVPGLRSPNASFLSQHERTPR